jgi:NADH-quinone oxidoreductase subunit G
MEDEAVSNMATCLQNHRPSTIILGAIAQNHPQSSLIRTLAKFMETMGVNVIFMTEGANAAGAWLAGMVPHRGPKGKALDLNNDTNTKLNTLDIQSALKAHLRAYIGLNIDPGFDIANPHVATKAMQNAECVAMITSFVNEELLKTADILLPSAVYAETSGTYVNLEGTYQSFKGAVPPKGEARPAWKIFRVLGNLFHAAGFDYESSEDVLEEIKKLETSELNATNAAHYYPEESAKKCNKNNDLASSSDTLTRIGEWPLYRVDDLSRYSAALQKSAPGKESILVRMHPETAAKHQIKGDKVRIQQGELQTTALPFISDERVALGSIYVPCAIPETRGLGNTFGAVSILNV